MSPRATGDGMRHSAWVRICHWIAALSFLALACSGVVILMAHPRLYWGEVGNDLTPALLELPINANHRPEGWRQTVRFDEIPNAPISASRTYEIFNQNGWARSLHFLAGWFLVVAGAFYIAAGFVSGHVRRDLLPRPRELAPRSLWADFKARFARNLAAPADGSKYGVLQRCAYTSVAFVALPLMVVTGLSMSPAVTAAHPVLLDVFGGQQSARTLHFFCFSALALFFVVHVAMVIRTGFGRQMRAMIAGG